MIILLFCLFIVTINQTIVSIAGPSILAELGGFKYYSWIFSGTALTAAICSPITGKLYDLYGPKIIIIFFLFIFTFFSLNVSSYLYKSIQETKEKNLLKTLKNNFKTKTYNN